MKKIHIIDSIHDVLMVAEIKEDHFATMITRGWISVNNWMRDESIYVMSHRRLIEFLDETAI